MYIIHINWRSCKKWSPTIYISRITSWSNNLSKSAQWFEINVTQTGFSLQPNQPLCNHHIAWSPVWAQNPNYLGREKFLLCQSPFATFCRARSKLAMLTEYWQASGDIGKWMVRLVWFHKLWPNPQELDIWNMINMVSDIDMWFLNCSVNCKDHKFCFCLRHLTDRWLLGKRL